MIQSTKISNTNIIFLPVNIRQYSEILSQIAAKALHLPNIDAYGLSSVCMYTKQDARRQYKRLQFQVWHIIHSEYCIDIHYGVRVCHV